MPVLDLDRMAVDDVAFSLERILAEVHRQLGDMPPPIPVFEIARRLGISEIRQEVLISLEGALTTNLERSEGTILVNRASHAFRKRFSVAHELGHFLCAWHQRTTDYGFACTGKDMRRWSGHDQHQGQEAEANRFAIELLAPPRLLASHLRRLPDLEHVLELSPKLEVSKEATARRYVALHRECLAAVFCKEGCYVYAERGSDFPYLPFERNAALPQLPRARGAEKISDMEEADPEAWFNKRVAGELGVQTHAQEDGRAIVLLHLEREADDDQDL